MHSLEEINTTRHEYRLTAAKKLHYLTLAAMCLVGAGFFFKLAIDPIGREFALGVGSVVLIPGLILVSLAVRSRLILGGSRIELRSALPTFTANRAEIEGLRKIENQYGRWTRICLKENSGAFNVSESFTGNDDLNEWLKGLPDLDGRDATEIIRQINNQDPLGVGESGRLNALKQAKAWMIGLSVAAGLVSILALVRYAPLHNPSMTLLALLPPLGILLVYRFPLLFTIFKRKPAPRVDIGLVILWPGIAMVLSYKTGSDPAHLVDISQLVYQVLTALLCYVAALFWVAWENPSRWSALAGLLLLGVLYSTGLINAANTVPDRSSAVLYRTEVLKMYETGESYYLRLAPWGPIAYHEDVDVPGRICQEVKVGDQVCIELHSGFLHAPWYTLTACPELAVPVPQVQ
jgi:hypothetical protein